MCGIAGVLGVEEERAVAAAESMRRALRHRGPDDDGFEIIDDPAGHAPPIVLTHTRLSILDTTSAGHQPMQDGASAPAWIAYNGELYNYREVRHSLEAEGQVCRSRCDTEVLLRALTTWGTQALQRMRGMFAFCAVQTATRTVLLGRDRLGIKPLYVARLAGGGLAFASELRALCGIGSDLLRPRVNPAAMEAFFAQGAVHGNDSIVQGVHLVPAGSLFSLSWDGEVLKRESYWQLPFGEGDVGTRRSAVAQLGGRLREAVSQHLRSDVPLGLFLSGGVDSAALGTLATEVSDARVVSLTVGFDEPAYDESDAARAIARELGTEHHTITLTGQEVLEHIDDAFGAVDQPTVDGFNVYFVSRAARQAGLKVVLSGLGGDELFGGYASFRDVPRATQVGRLLSPARPLLRPFVRRFAERAGRAGVKLAELFERDPGTLGMYLLRRELFLPASRRLLHSLPAGVDAHCGLSRDALVELDLSLNGLDAANQISLLELTTYMRHMLLRDSDVFSMRHGLELRVPLLDHEVAAAAAAMPGRWKRPDPRPKPLLIDAVGPRMPQSSYTGKKRGFTFPWDSWLRGSLAGYAAARLHDDERWVALGVDPEVPARLWERFQQRSPHVQGLQVLGLLVLSDFAARTGLEAAR